MKLGLFQRGSGGDIRSTPARRMCVSGHISNTGSVRASDRSKRRVWLRMPLDNDGDARVHREAPPVPIGSVVAPWENRAAAAETGHRAALRDELRCALRRSPLAFAGAPRSAIASRCGSAARRGRRGLGRPGIDVTTVGPGVRAGEQAGLPEEESGDRGQDAGHRVGVCLLSTRVGIEYLLWCGATPQLHCLRRVTAASAPRSPVGPPLGLSPSPFNTAVPTVGCRSVNIGRCVRRTAVRCGSASTRGSAHLSR